MSDASLLWGGDLNPSPIGDISTVSGGVLGQQRVLRRLLTNPGDYLWQPDYGAGLGQFVGKACNIPEIRAKIRSQIFHENVVARLPEPNIQVETPGDGSIYIRISYVDSGTGASQVISFSVSV